MTKKNSTLFTTIAFWIPSLSLTLSLIGGLVSPSLAQIKKVKITDRPIIDEKTGEIVVRVRVEGENNQPIKEEIEENRFSLIVDCESPRDACKTINSNDPEWTHWENPQQAIPPPAYIVMLLDFSGSMTGRDQSGVTKLNGAINAINKLTDFLKQKRAENTKISIVPFSTLYGDYSKCSDNPVTDTQINRFLSVKDIKLQNYLNHLSQEKPCADTNIYTPLATTLSFLKTDARFNPPEDEDSNVPTPRTAVILLSDGLHVTPSEIKNRRVELSGEKLEFQNLLDNFLNYDVSVYTLGYGWSRKQLQRKNNLSRLPTRKDVCINERKTRSCRISESRYIDEERLQQIASATGGRYAISGNADDISLHLQDFLNSLLGEYEIRYQQPQAETGSYHDVKVIVDSKESNVENYNLDWVKSQNRAIDSETRFQFFFWLLILLVGAVIIPFIFWAKEIEKEY